MIFDFCLVEKFAYGIVFLLVCKVAEDNPFAAVRAFIISNGISFALIYEVVNSLGFYQKKEIIFSHCVYFIEKSNVSQYKMDLLENGLPRRIRSSQ